VKLERLASESPIASPGWPSAGAPPQEWRAGFEGLPAAPRLEKRKGNGGCEQRITIANKVASTEEDGGGKDEGLHDLAEHAVSPFFTAAS
jgi:hypothetical protein